MIFFTYFLPSYSLCISLGIVATVIIISYIFIFCFVYKIFINFFKSLIFSFVTRFYYTRVFNLSNLSFRGGWIFMSFYFLLRPILSTLIFFDWFNINVNILHSGLSNWNRFVFAFHKFFKQFGIFDRLNIDWEAHPRNIWTIYSYSL